MRPLSIFEKWYGRDVSPPGFVELRAGPLDVEFQEGDLRYIRIAGREVVRRIYVAIRDVNWNTIPARMTDLFIQSAEDHFRIEFDAFHESGPLAFRWHASLEGKPDGVIEYSMDGHAESDFRYCRIGFCVLHPVVGVAGSPYRALTPDGPVSGVLPELIAPQLMENGLERPMFPSFSTLAIDTSFGISIVTGFEGDLFEMEDQRNWTDGSFKTYCTPISLGYPHQARAGQPFHQKVTASMHPSTGPRPTQPFPESEEVRLTVGDITGQRLPSFGFGMPSHRQAMTSREAELLAGLSPRFLKAELHLGDASWFMDLRRAIAAARQLGTALELALFLDDDSGEQLETLKGQLSGVPVARVIVFHEAEAPLGTTSPRWVLLAREHLSAVLPATPFLGGTNGNFAELNRQRPDLSAMDGVAYPINPQVHASDERSLVEAIEGQRDTVVTARSYRGALPISVSSVTLKPPFNQAAREQEASPDPDELPAAADQRQMALFAAAWTVGSIRSLSLGGADSVTYYETTGWRGLMETADGSPLPEKFRSFPGMLFPVYWVFAFLAGAEEAAVLPLSSERPLFVQGLAFQNGHRLRLLVANLQPYSQAVRLTSLPDGKASLRHLNEDTMVVAASDPDAFLSLSAALDISGGEAALALLPYETAFLEIPGV